MSEITISLNNIQNIKTVNIEGHGAIHARKLGSGEELDLSAKMRRTGKIIEELSAIDFTKFNTGKPEDLKKVTKIANRAEELSDELEAIKRFEFNTYKNLLSDDKNGKVVDVIMNTLSEKERAALFDQIFGEIKVLETPEEKTEDVAEARDE